MIIQQEKQANGKITSPSVVPTGKKSARFLQIMYSPLIELVSSKVGLHAHLILLLGNDKLITIENVRDQTEPSITVRNIDDANYDKRTGYIQAILKTSHARKRSVL